MGDKRGPPGIHKADPKRPKFGVSVSEILADPLTPLASAYWGVGAKDLKPYEPSIIEDIYKNELANKPLLNDRVQLLEISGYLENYLWKYFDDTKATFAHVMSIIILVNEKFRQNLLDVWKTFETRDEYFVPFIQRVWTLKVATNLSMSEKYSYLLFVIHAFQSLENATIRSACLRLTSPVLWQTLTPGTLKKQIKLFPGYKRFLKKVQKSASKNKAVGEIEKNFLPDLIGDFVSILKSITPESLAAKPGPTNLAIHYCERFLELMVDLMAQLPTRRFFHAVLSDTQFAVLCELSKLNRDMGQKEGKLFSHMFDLLKYYLNFEIDDQSGSPLTDDAMMTMHYEKFQHFQNIVFKHFKTELADVATANVASIETRKSLGEHLHKLEVPKLRALCEYLGILEPLAEGAGDHLSKEILLEMLVYHFEKRKSRKQEVRELPLYPTERILWDEDFVPSQNYVGEGCLALPKLNLQFLTLHDYLLRNFNLYRLESTYEIRADIADTIFRLKPRLSPNMTETVFTGYTRMAIPIYSFAITQVRKPKIGESKPALVKGDITVDLTPFARTPVRQEWEELREHDVLFLLTIEAKPDMSDKKWNQNDAGFDWEAVNRDSLGITTVRGAEIIRVLDEDKKVIGEMDEHGNRHVARGNVRTYQVELDAAQYQEDMQDVIQKDVRDPYTTFNLLLRRKAKENNFRAVLATIRDLMYEECRMPDWLHDVFLGYGNPQAAQYHNIPQQLTHCEYRDTFQDHAHIQDSFPEMVKFESEAGKEWTPAGTFYKIEFLQGQKPNHVEIQTLLPFAERKAAAPVVAAPKAPEEKKKKRKVAEAEEVAVEEKERVITVTPYSRPKVWGETFVKRNLVRFTPMQAEAIKSGLMKGLTQIVGPPGTGKTDTAVQIISELYHNFPDQRILLVTHSNHALNDLFEKIMERDIDERYLLRLGRGQDFLQSDKDFSKFGRVNHMLDRRLKLLDEVSALATAMDVKDDVGSTCETAHHFFNYHVLASWELFQQTIKKPELHQGRPFSKIFPFTLFFEGLQDGRPVFEDGEDVQTHLEANMEVAHSCWRYLQLRFTELDETKPFERMRTGKDRGTYLLTKHAKVIAMTCTHAAINRATLIKSGFQFDNIIMEEAAQILEIETFIPMMLQVDDKEFGNRLQRVILLGDHYQLPPVIKNPAFQKFCHMDQSMFTRFVRLGMPYIQLNAQGRMRPALADLWNWKYENLNNLPNVTSPRYLKANAGMRHVMQLIDVDGEESSPTPFFYQNLQEAEYVCATYQYMRLLGYPASKISIITSYNGQKSLLRDVFAAKCHNDPLYGDPAKITTVDKFQGQQNDFILLSLVRTKVAGHIRDVRRLVVAMSRARLGLYVFCKKDLYLNCFELTRTFNVLMKNPTQFELYPKENTEEYELQGLAPTRLASDTTPECTTISNLTEMTALVHKLKTELKAAFELYAKRVAEAEAQQAAQDRLQKERETRAREARKKQEAEDALVQRAAQKQAEYAAQTEVFMEVASKKMDEAEDAEEAEEEEA